MLARIPLKPLQPLVEQTYPDCDFRTNRSTTDKIFAVRQVQEKSHDQHQLLYIAFVDLIKIFHLVDSKALFVVLNKIGCPLTLLAPIKSFHGDMQECSLMGSYLIIFQLAEELNRVVCVHQFWLVPTFLLSSCLHITYKKLNRCVLTFLRRW